MKLTQKEKLKYQRHFTLSEVGVKGQLKLKQSKILIVGTGGLGSPISLYLAAAGIGTLGLIDFDVVDESNLQRQILFKENQVNKSKVKTAKLELEKLNSQIKIKAFELKLNSKNAMKLFSQYDIIIDGTDNFATRYLTNDASYLAKKPLISGSILGFEGQLSVYNYKNGPCYRCLYPKPPPPDAVPNCAENGVLGVLPGVIGCLQALEAIKIILEKGEVLTGKLLVYDALSTEFLKLKIEKNKDCPLCGTQEIKKLVDYEEFCGLKKIVDKKSFTKQLSAKELKKWIKEKKKIQILDVREKEELDNLGFIKNSIHIPLKDLIKNLNKLDPHKDLVCYCQGGVRSLKACGILSANGFKKLFNLQDGFKEF